MKCRTFTFCGDFRISRKRVPFQLFKTNVFIPHSVSDIPMAMFSKQSTVVGRKTWCSLGSLSALEREKTSRMESADFFSAVILINLLLVAVPPTGHTGVAWTTLCCRQTGVTWSVSTTKVVAAKNHAESSTPSSQGYKNVFLRDILNGLARLLQPIVWFAERRARFLS